MLNLIYMHTLLLFIILKVCTNAVHIEFAQSEQALVFKPNGSSQGVNINANSGESALLEDIPNRSF